MLLMTLPLPLAASSIVRIGIPGADNAELHDATILAGDRPGESLKISSQQVSDSLSSADTLIEAVEQIVVRTPIVRPGWGGTYALDFVAPEIFVFADITFGESHEFSGAVTVGGGNRSLSSSTWSLFRDGLTLGGGDHVFSSEVTINGGLHLEEGVNSLTTDYLSLSGYVDMFGSVGSTGTWTITANRISVAGAHFAPGLSWELVEIGPLTHQLTISGPTSYEYSLPEGGSCLAFVVVSALGCSWCRRRQLR